MRIDGELGGCDSRMKQLQVDNDLRDHDPVQEHI